MKKKNQQKIRKEVREMIQPDTIKLLRECDAGIKMGTSSIQEVLPYVKNETFLQAMEECQKQHESLQQKIDAMLADYQDEGKDPTPMAKGMSYMKTNVRLAMDESDETVADLITDGCNMGVKSLSRYLNQYEAAEEKAKDIAKKLIYMEEKLAEDVRQFL